MTTITNKEYPKLSVIIPTFNSAKTLVECLESVVQQSYKDIEVWLIDGISIDNTIEIIKNYATQYDFVHWISEKDKGVYDAMNKGIERAKGEWLYFLGSDDVFFDKEVLRRIFINHKNVVANSDYLYANIIWGDGYVYNGQTDVLKLYSSNISHQAIFVKKDVFRRTGAFKIEYIICADYYLNMQCFTDDGIKKNYIPIIIANFFANGLSSVANDSFMEKKYVLFEQHLKKQSYETQLQFRILYADKEGIINTTKWLFYLAIRDTLNTILVRKLRKLFRQLYERLIHQP